MFDSPFAANRFDQDAAHGFAGRCKKMAPTLEFLVSDQSQIRFVNQGGCLQRLAGIFAPHVMVSETM
jgi:hypothetical protein